jgi:hypothetical protein
MMKNKMGKPESEIEISIEPAEKEEGMEKEDEEEGEEEYSSKEMDYKAECDANDLMRAAEIKNDPARMKKAMAILQKKKAAIESVADLKAARNAAFTKES